MRSFYKEITKDKPDKCSQFNKDMTEIKKNSIIKKA